MLTIFDQMSRGRPLPHGLKDFFERKRPARLNCAETVFPADTVDSLVQSFLMLCAGIKQVKLLPIANQIRHLNTDKAHLFLCSGQSAVKQTPGRVKNNIIGIGSFS